MKYQGNLRWIWAVIVAIPMLSEAASSLHYRLAGSSTVQPIVIKEGRVLIPGLDATDHRDLLFDRSRDQAVVIDHKTQTFVTVDDQAIDRLSRQSEPLQPLIAGIGAQLGKLSSEQRAKWQSMLGGVDLEKVANIANSSHAPTRVAKGERHFRVGAYDCDRLTVLTGKKKLAELCVSQADTLGLSAEDYATIRALFDFAQRLALKTRGFSSLMGWSIPVVSIEDIPGVPVEIRDLSGQHHATLSLASIEPAVQAADTMNIPEGYRREPLKLW